MVGGDWDRDLEVLQPLVGHTVRRWRRDARVVNSIVHPVPHPPPATYHLPLPSP
jgi:hypothetical protein